MEFEIGDRTDKEGDGRGHGTELYFYGLSVFLPGGGDGFGACSSIPGFRVKEGLSYVFSVKQQQQRGKARNLALR